VKASKELKELVMSLKDRVCALDYNLIVQPKKDFEYEEVISEAVFDLLSIGVELRAIKRRKKK